MLAGAVAATRLAFRSHRLYDLDSINFALGILRFDPRVQQPHPPGYFLYVLLGRLVNTVVHDPNLALVLISVAASCGAIVLIYQLAKEWFGLGAARIAGFIFLFSPLAWFHGVVALTYSVEAFFSALLGYLCWRIEQGERRVIPLAAVALAAAAGFRPSSFLFLAPLFLYSMRHASWKAISAGIASLGATLAAWFFPMIVASGGFSAYFGALLFLWRTVPSRNTVFNSSPANSIVRGATIVGILLLIFGAMLAAPLAAWGHIGSSSKDPSGRGKWRFTLVWVTPALLFFIFIFLQFVNSGYLLLVSPAGCLWLSYLIAESFRSAELSTRRKVAALASAALINTWIFLASPFYCSWRSVHRFESSLSRIESAFPEESQVGATLVVAFDSHFLGFRHAGYYLPDYLTIEYPEFSTGEGVRVFAMRHRETSLLVRVSTVGYKRFVLFPLPAGADYREYLQTVLKLLPRADIQTVRVDGETLITCPISDLHFLFPAAAPQAAEERAKAIDKARTALH